MLFNSSDNETLVPEWAILGGNNICVISPDLGSLRDQYLALINQAGGLYGRILTEAERSEVCTHDRGQDSPIQTNLARLIRCLLYGRNQNNSILLM